MVREHPLWESYFRTWKKLYCICSEEINVGRASPSTFWNVGHGISIQEGSDDVKPFGLNLVKIEEAQLKISLHTRKVSLMLMKNDEKNHDDLMRPYRVIAPQSSK